MNSFTLEIVTPDGAEPSCRITSLGVPAHDGRLTVLAHHQPFICLLRSGTLVIRMEDGTEATREIDEGSMRVTRDGVTLLVRAIT
jgi:F-type H+-transporting ATPase subunit epsilon